MAYFFIINPVAGRGRALQAWNELHQALQQSELEYTFALTKGPGHATELAREAVANGFSACIGVGGDGTLHEMLSSLMGSETALGCVPAGTGNDFARSAGIPRNLAAQPSWLINAVRVQIDVPRVNGEAYLNAAGAGFDAVVADTVNRQFKSLHGTLPYLLAVFKTLFQYRNAPVTIYLDGHAPLEEKMLLVAAGNMQYYGGGIRICPKANPTDGLLDFCIATNLTKAEVTMVLPKTFSGSHLTHPKCMYLQATGARIEGPPLPIQADGQIIGTLPATFTVSRRALWILRPSDAAIFGA